MLVDHNLKLALKLGVLLGSGLGIRSHAGHVLDYNETQLVASLVVEVRLNLNLFDPVKLVPGYPQCNGEEIFSHACGPC